MQIVLKYNSHHKLKSDKTTVDRQIKTLLKFTQISDFIIFLSKFEFELELIWSWNGFEFKYWNWNIKEMVWFEF